jgi:hypothetical protein
MLLVPATCAHAWHTTLAWNKDSRDASCKLDGQQQPASKTSSNMYWKSSKALLQRTIVLTHNQCKVVWIESRGQGQSRQF